MKYPDLEQKGISKKVCHAIRNLPRELFVPEPLKIRAYEDCPLGIDCGQTISQPSLVAYMTDKLELKKTDRVLEIGTGSGFQTALLAQLTRKIYTIEVHADLAKEANGLLNKLGLRNVSYLIGDGKNG